MKKVLLALFLEKLRVKVNDALDLAERSQANTDKCLKHVSTLVNIVWDYTPEQIQEIRNTIPKPSLKEIT